MQQLLSPVPPRSRSALLLACLVFVTVLAPPPVLHAHTMGNVDKTCPLCDTKFTAKMDLSGTQFGMRLDLKPLGPIAAPWRLAVCPECKFVLYKESNEKYSDEECATLRAYVNSEEYKGISSGDSSYYRLGRIFEHLKKEPLNIGHIYLKASWQVEKDEKRCAAYLKKSLAHFQSYLSGKPKDEKARQTAQFLVGELQRRLKTFDSAKDHFESLRKMKEFKEGVFPRMITYELELIAKKDSAPHEIPAGKQ